MRESKNREEREEVKIDFETKWKGAVDLAAGLDVAAALVTLRHARLFHNYLFYVTFVP